MARASGELNRYPDGGSYRLQEALAARHGVAFDQICVGSGADGCLDMLSQATLDAGDEIVCGWPSFPSYLIYAAKQGARATTVPLVDNRYDLPGLAAAVGPRTKLVYVCHPNNPTGTMNTADELDDVRRPGARPRPGGDRPGLLRVHRAARLSRRGRALREGRPARRRPAHVLEDLRPRGAEGGLRRRPAGRLRGDGEGAPAVRPDDPRAGGSGREPRRRGRGRPPARAQRRGTRAPRRAPARGTGSTRLRARSGTSSTSRWARPSPTSTSGCCARA